MAPCRQKCRQELSPAGERDTCSRHRKTNSGSVRAREAWEREQPCAEEETLACKLHTHTPPDGLSEGESSAQQPQSWGPSLGRAMPGTRDGPQHEQSTCNGGCPLHPSKRHRVQQRLTMAGQGRELLAVMALCEVFFQYSCQNIQVKKPHNNTREDIWVAGKAGTAPAMSLPQIER